MNGRVSVRLRRETRFVDVTFPIGTPCERASDEEAAAFLATRDMARSCVEDGSWIVVFLGGRFRFVDREDVA